MEMNMEMAIAIVLIATGVAAFAVFPFVVRAVVWVVKVVVKTVFAVAVVVAVFGAIMAGSWSTASELRSDYNITYDGEKVSLCNKVESVWSEELPQLSDMSVPCRDANAFERWSLGK